MRRPERHELVWLSRAGWRRLQAGSAAADTELLAHWARRDLPLVATRRPPGLPSTEVALGLPAPQRWGGRRLSFAARCAELARLGAFPTLAEAIAALPGEIGQRLLAVADVLGDRAATVRVYGSHGWQVLSGLDCLRAGSDLDLLLPVADDREAARLCGCLDRYSGALRVDGELLLPEGRAVSWREWHRVGPTGQVLVKQLEGAALVPRKRLWSMAEVAVA